MALRHVDQSFGLNGLPANSALFYAAFGQTLFVVFELLEFLTGFAKRGLVNAAIVDGIHSGNSPYGVFRSNGARNFLQFFDLNGSSLLFLFQSGFDLP